MVTIEALRKGDHAMTVCNSCRYCEAYCPVFVAMERRRTFTTGDLTYLANLCHNCGECLYACQYAPPHEFAINVPQTFADIRVVSYREYCWPRPLAAAFDRNGLVTSIVLVAAFSLWMLASSRVPADSAGGEFYRVISHDTMVLAFSGVSLFVLAALTIGAVRFLRAATTLPSASTSAGAFLRGLWSAMTLRHLHSGTDDTNCTDAEESRAPWRRWFHHCTTGGFALCFASTSTAAFYHSVLGWEAPYGYTSLPVLLGTTGGLGLAIGPIGLLALRSIRDPELTSRGQHALDTPFLVMLLATSLTGLLLLAFRESGAMRELLVVHLALVLTLFVMMPYGKFVHGIYRALAIVQHEIESDAEHRPVAS